jgi:O-succinylbenzoic acid--CoA ligase
LIVTKFHSNFQLNGFSFSSVDELLTFTEVFSDEIQQFLKSWFSNDDFITLKTSGSTGVPKEIRLQKGQMINSAKATGKFFDLKENTTALLCLPVAYIAGKMMLVRALTLGWHLDVITSNSFPLRGINKRYDFTAMVPLQLENSLGSINLIKTLIVGGGVVSNQLINKLETIFTQVFATYGMTETITHIAVKKLNNFKNDAYNIFQNFYYEVLPNIEIYKDQRNCLVIGAPEVSNDFVFTNDIVNLISNTQFEWLGRFDHVINSGGIKLHPERIEEKLSNIITGRFFVAGISDDKLGEKLVLLVEGKHQTLQIKDANLSKFETPKEIYFVEMFIETETKKIQRKKTLNLILYN